MTEQHTLETLSETGNIAETLAREMKQPMLMQSNAPHISRTALPPGWMLNESDDEHHMMTPRRKVATVHLNTAESFIDYVVRHADDQTTIWCIADYAAGKVALQAIINDHGAAGEREGSARWRDHIAHYIPVQSQEWKSWSAKNRSTFTQADFAAFIEENLRDIASVEGMPTGANMLEMALQFEANQDMRYKSAIRLQNGGVQMSFVQDDDDQTLAKMQMFDRFAIGLPIFWGGDAYRIEARLRYRVREGRLTFWYELIRPEKVIEAAADTLIEQIRVAGEWAFFYGNPGIR